MSAWAALALALAAADAGSSASLSVAPSAPAQRGADAAALGALSRDAGAVAAPGDAGRAAVLRLGPAPLTPVQRVVTLAPSLTELVMALGAKERLVGVSRFDEAPEVSALPRVGGFNDVGVETVYALKPGLLLVQKAPGNQRPVEALAALGVPVLALPLTSLEDVFAATAAIGEALGREKEAAHLVAELRAVRARVRAKAQAKGPGPRVLFVYGFSPLVVAGPGSFAHELLEDCGARNLAQKAPTPYPVYSVERAAAQRPQLIIDASDVAAGREALRALPGLREARWVQLPSKALLHPGPALQRGLEELFALLWASPDAG